MPARRQPTSDGGRAQLLAKAFIGVDPHRLSATIEVVDGHERVLATGRFGTDKAGTGCGSTGACALRAT